MEPIRVGIVGVGAMGLNHVRAYERNPVVTIVGVADTNPAAAASAGDEFGVPHFAEAGELIGKTDVQAVSICTNDESHVEPALTAIESGVHVLLEKPIATRIDDADRIIKAAESSDVVLLVGHLLRFEPRYAEAATCITSGEIGDVISIFARRLNHVGTQNVLKGRVSVLSFLGVHDFDICQWLAGSQAQRVHCEAHSGLLSDKGYEVEDHTFTTVRFHNGVVACVEAGWVLPDNHPRQADFSLEVIGTSGVINLELMSSGISVCGNDGFRYPRLGNALELQINHFIACIRGDEVPAISGAEALHALEISLAAQESSRSGDSVTFS